MGVEAGGGGGDPTGMLENEMREKPFMDCSQLVEQAGLNTSLPFSTYSDKYRRGSGCSDPTSAVEAKQSRQASPEKDGQLVEQGRMTREI